MSEEERTALARERNRLANERTFLSWTRTGLAIIGGGFVMIRMLTFQYIAHQLLAQWIGGILFALGIAIFILSWIDYRASSKKLNVDNGYAGSVCTISVISFILVAVSIGLFLVAIRIVEWL